MLGEVGFQKVIIDFENETFSSILNYFVWHSGFFETPDLILNSQASQAVQESLCKKGEILSAETELLTKSGHETFASLKSLLRLRIENCSQKIPFYIVLDRPGPVRTPCLTVYGRRGQSACHVGGTRPSGLLSKSPYYIS